MSTGHTGMGQAMSLNRLGDGHAGTSHTMGMHAMRAGHTGMHHNMGMNAMGAGHACLGQTMSMNAMGGGHGNMGQGIHVNSMGVGPAGMGNATGMCASEMNVMSGPLAAMQSVASHISGGVGVGMGRAAVSSSDMAVGATAMPSAPATTAPAAPERRRMYSGVVKMLDLERSCGFIETPEMDFLTGQDVYVHKEVLEKARASVGDIVCFPVHWSAKGQPKASAPLLRLGVENGYALVGVFQAASNRNSSATVDMVVGESSRPGLIECHDVRAVLEMDVYVNPVIASKLKPGARVGFNAYLNKDYVPSVLSATEVDDAFDLIPGDLSMSRIAAGYDGPKKAPGRGGRGNVRPTGERY